MFHTQLKKLKNIGLVLHAGLLLLGTEFSTPKITNFQMQLCGVFTSQRDPVIYTFLPYNY